MKEERFQTYLFEYYYDGQRWGIEIKASSLEDARDRVLQISQARYLGVVQMHVPAKLGIVARLACWIRNRAGK